MVVSSGRTSAGVTQQSSGRSMRVARCFWPCVGGISWRVSAGAACRCLVAAETVLRYTGVPSTMGSFQVPIIVDTVVLERRCCFVGGKDSVFCEMSVS